MTTPIPLRCTCGDVRARLDHEPAAAQRVVCYCDDCQAFMRHLGREDGLDASGGTDILQVWPARMKLLAVPRLAVGDALEVESYTKGFLIATSMS